jgi:endonuclease-3
MEQLLHSARQGCCSLCLPEASWWNSIRLVTSDLSALRDRLVDEGTTFLALPPATVPFTGEPDADELLNDLAGHPHAFLLASLVERQMPAKRAWMVPQLIRDRVGSFEIQDLATLDGLQWVRLMREPTPAHRFPDVTATVLARAVKRVMDVYGSDASRIWAATPSSATLVRRFLEFYGSGPKIATMAANILVRNFHIPVSDHRCIDISADAQVLRVMARLGFVESGARPEVVVYAARDLNPDFPGIFDLALWDLGRSVCRPVAPLCASCRLADLCRYAKSH